MVSWIDPLLDLAPAIAVILVAIYGVNAYYKQERLKQLIDVYRKLNASIDSLQDYGLGLVELNWYKIRRTYNDALLMASDDVIKAYNQVFELILNTQTSSEMNPDQRLEFTNKVKDFRNVMRNDLYKLKKLPSDSMKFIEEGAVTKAGLNILKQVYPKLVQIGISSLEHMKDMNIDDVNSETGINKDALIKIKRMAENEYSLQKEASLR